MIGVEIPRTGPPVEPVRSELERILASRCFQRSLRLRDLLRFLVARSLRQPDGNLKEYVIGTEVFGKPESFDPRADPIVRVQAARLRAKLKTYYQTDGRDDRVEIKLLAGSYVPVFAPRDPEREAAAQQSRGTRPAVAVCPFIRLGRARSLRRYAQGLTAELIYALAKIDSLRIVLRSDGQAPGGHNGAAWLLEGTIRSEDGRIRLSAVLTSLPDRAVAWCEVCEIEEPGPLNQRQAAQRIASGVSDAIASKLF